MAEDEKTPPVLSEAGRDRAAAREARLATALRENLRLRKAQQRARTVADPPPDDADGKGR